MTDLDAPAVGILYEHPDWFRPLFAELERRGVPYLPVHAGEHFFDPGGEPPFPVLLNRMSPSAGLRGGRNLVSWTSQYLADLEHRGVRVINGSPAWRVEVSKARQLSLLRRLGLPAPASRVVHDPAHVPAAAVGLRFPVVVKPNVGGSGAGVRRFDGPAELARAAREPDGFDFGVDGTALVQEFVPARDGRIVRVEVLDGRFLYAIRIYLDGEGFNLCPADLCRTVDGAELARGACPADAPRNGLRVEAWEPPAEVVTGVEAVLDAAGIAVGGVEYMIDDRDGRAVFYDVNALSNFVADAPRLLGFDPFVRLVDWLEAEVGLRPRGGGRPRVKGPAAAAAVR